MPHLLSLNSYHYRRGGSDAVYFDHAELLRERGWYTSFMSMKHPRNFRSDDERYFADLVDYEFVEGPIDKLRTARRSIYNVDARRKAERLVSDKQIDIAHVHCIYHHLTPSVFPVLKEAGIPLVLTSHDLKIGCPAYLMRSPDGVCEACKGGNYLNVIRKRCIKGSLAASATVAAEAYLHRALGSYENNLDMVVAPSTFNRDKLIEWGWPSDRITYIPNFTRIIGTRFRSDYSGRILFFGRLSPEKGVSTLIEASAISGVAVDIVGTGPIEQELQTLAKQLDAPVTFFGRLDGDALWEKVGAARAVVMPSECYENAPLAVLEAFQLERPLIGADIGGIPELAHPAAHDPCGWLFPSGDARALAERLVEVDAMSPAELRQRGAAGRALALERFSKERYISEMLEVYAALGVTEDRMA